MDIHQQQGPSTGRIGPIPFYRDWLLAVAVAIVLASDQITKAIVRANLSIGESWPAEGLFRFTHGTNTGSAFGLFQDQTFILTIASVAAIGFIIYFYRSQTEGKLITRITIGLLLGGAIGNLIDRLVAGRVTDFIDVGAWPIFNIADSSIVVGMTLMIATLILTPEESPDPDPLPVTGEQDS
ncbi:MAG: signal peptidase II [SAR202 cluster bacterium]|jgi:signal peptidase II|nr:signal peptidase II [SAR202 cluster bacterium]MDP6514715.1 signal peptidase II [SAR202 cluster bacterium]MDP6715718.1 signal peptidase II [SAR202 cluster bacterium]